MNVAKRVSRLLPAASTGSALQEFRAIYLDWETNWSTRRVLNSSPRRENPFRDPASRGRSESASAEASRHFPEQCQSRRISRLVEQSGRRSADSENPHSDVH